MDENSPQGPEPSPRRQVRAAGASRSARFEARFARATGDHEPLPAPELREVRSLAGQQVEIGDAVLKFTSLELWSTLSTTLGAGVSHLGNLHFEDRVVEPAPPPEATVLTLVASGAETGFLAELPL